MLEVRVERFFRENGNYVEQYTAKNLRDVDVFVGQDNFGIEVPFNDKYTYADECMTNRCNTHIWCGRNTAYVCALKMGPSDCNLGLILTQGGLDSYSVLRQPLPGEHYRGRFLLNSTAFELCADETYVLEWELFWHKGKEDFCQIARCFPQFIDIQAEQETVLDGEAIRFTASLPEGSADVTVNCGEKQLDFSRQGDEITVAYLPDGLGPCRVWIQADGICTYADFLTVPSFSELVRRRLDFIVKKQQYHKENSPLRGAFLIYDNEEDRLVFDNAIPDYNACRERMGMVLLLVRYLREHEDPALRAALDYFVEFLKREFYEEATGEVFNTVGKNRDMIRLYNAPWIVMFFSEMYFLTGDTYYTKQIVKVLQNYYEKGGKKFYPNGLSMCRTMAAMRQAGDTAAAEQVLAWFRAHADNILEVGLSYPKHEVNYEQTIVTPAATFISEMGLLTGEEKYLEAARQHIAVLARFSGWQPSYHLDEIPIRYWDDFWFGKSRIMGDTFPHYWSCLTAKSYMMYYKLSGEIKYLNAAKRCIRNCLCLFTDDGKGSCAYVFPYAIDGKRGQFYDAWANDQDFALYFAMALELF